MALLAFYVVLEPLDKATPPESQEPPAVRKKGRLASHLGHKLGRIFRVPLLSLVVHVSDTEASDVAVRPVDETS